MTESNSTGLRVDSKGFLGDSIGLEIRIRIVKLSLCQCCQKNGHFLKIAKMAKNCTIFWDLIWTGLNLDLIPLDSTRLRYDKSSCVLSLLYSYILLPPFWQMRTLGSRTLGIFTPRYTCFVDCFGLQVSNSMQNSAIDKKFKNKHFKAL